MIKTGKSPMTLMTYLAIMSISLIVNLPGLAVTPMLGTLTTIFPHTTQIEKQLLTALPNLLIIPFVLMSGKLSLTRHKLGIIVGGLVLFTACAVAYMFAPSMMWLIVVSCLLGCAAGLLIPFSTGLIADTFCGNYRMTQMGIQSGISNSALVIATFVVGWLSHGNWHLPFAVYLVCVIPLLLTFWLRGVTQNSVPASAAGAACTTESADATPVKPGEKIKGGFYINRIWALIGVYFFITFASISISYYCPFLIEKRDWGASLSGTVTAIYFLFILMPGYFLPFFVKILKGYTFFWSAVMMMIGQALFVFCPGSVTMCIGAALVGLGYGICQPILYDKATDCVNDSKKSTQALSFVLSANYLAIVVSPFLIGFLRGIFHVQPDNTFAFLVSFILLAFYVVITFVMRKRFAFSVSQADM